MFRQASTSRAIAADVAEIERRLRSLEKRLQRTGGAVSAGAVQAVDRAGEVVASALGDMAERFRGGARSVSDEASKFGHGAARVGNDAVRWIADEVERRPLTAIAVVAGIGILVGLSSRRH
jgi:ElaB/YqjD/DUF883 family membrane-anchored ribosome-binding protein